MAVWNAVWSSVALAARPRSSLSLPLSRRWPPLLSGLRLGPHQPDRPVPERRNLQQVGASAQEQEFRVRVYGRHGCSAFSATVGSDSLNTNGGGEGCCRRHRNRGICRRQSIGGRTRTEEAVSS